jgi:DNA-binding SARP family transcriptional activator/predicted ATPase
MAEFELRLFGSPQLTQGGQPVELNLRKAVALFVYLAVSRQPHSRDQLATLFWPDDGQRAARANLRRTLYRITESLGKEILTFGTETLELNPDAELWIDSETFQQEIIANLPVAGRPDELSDTALTRLAAAAALYTDDFMAGFTLPDCPDFDDWQFFQREALRRSLARAVEALALAHQTDGQAGEAIIYARRWLALDPLHEPAHRLLMQLYAAAGQQAAARRQFEECKRLLAAELDMAPSPETTALFEAIRSRSAGVVKGQTVASPALAPLPDAPIPIPAQRGPRQNLPIPATPFVGRAKEVAALVERLGSPACRLLTLVGPGGIGKSRLALAAAQQLAEGDHEELIRDGLFFVSLTPATSPNDIVPAIGRALGIQFSDDARLRRQLLAYLAQKQLILVLDGFEQLLEGVDLLSEILLAAAGVKLLVTSREALNLQEEWFYAVQEMTFPDADKIEIEAIAQYDAVRLFEHCAQRSRVGFSLATEARGVARICRLVQGMPMALELAASWLKVLTVEGVADELASGLDILTARHRNVPERHQSLRVVFDTSWQLLAEPERRAFARLAVFRGGFTYQAAQRVAEITLPLLSALVNKSLLRRESDGRYLIHELLRQYAAQKLAETPGESALLSDRHCHFFGAFLQARQGELKGERQLEALNEIGNEIENIRAGWQQALDQLNNDPNQISVVDAYIEALFHFFDIRSQFRGGEEIFRRAANQLSAGQAPATLSTRKRTLLAKVWGRQGWFLFHLGQHDQAQTLLRESAETLLALGARAEALFSLNYLGAVLRHMGDYEAAQQAINESLAICQANGDRFGLSVAYNILGQIAYLQEDFAAVRHYCQESLALKRLIGDRWGTVFSLNYLGRVARRQGETVEARRLFEESMAISRSLGDRRGVAASLSNLGKLAENEGDYIAAAEQYGQSLALYQEIHNLSGVAAVRTELGDLACSQGDHHEAWRQLHTALGIAQDLRSTRHLLDALLIIAALLHKTGDAEAAAPILQAIRHHPASGPARQGRAQRLLADLALQSPDAEATSLPTAPEEVDDQQIEQLAAQTLARLHPIPVP